MSHTENDLKQKIRDKLIELLDAGSKVAAIKFYCDVAMTPLLESKQFIESMQAERNISFGDEVLDEFLKLLEERDFGGAAARLLDDLDGKFLPDEAIDRTLLIARLLDVDLSQMELPPTSQTELSQIWTAQSIVYQRAEIRIRQRMVQNLVKGGTDQEEAEAKIDELFQSQSRRAYVRPDLNKFTFEGLEPDVAIVVRRLLGPVPLTTTTHAYDASMPVRQDGDSNPNREIFDFSINSHFRISGISEN